MKIEVDSWLSTIFHYNVYRISEIDTPPTLSISIPDVKQTLLKNNGLVYVKVPANNLLLIHALNNLGFKVVDVTVTFERIPTPVKPTGKTITRISKEEDKESLEEIAGTSFSYSRFHLDPLIPDTTANKIKREWISNYFTTRQENQVIVAVQEGRPVGFLAIKTIGSTGVVDLIAIHKNYQNRGLGTLLVNHFINNAVGNYDRLRVGTQVANIPSMNLYYKCGFTPIESTYVLHAHISKGRVL